MARKAQSLEVLLSQIDAKYPGRSKSSDGWIGDAAHQATKSDHNPNSAGVVQAIDITHDPANGVDTWALAETLRLNRDPRIKYVISNGRIFSSVVDPWNWRPYTGANAHAHHVHVSVSDSAHLYDSGGPWKLDRTVKPGVNDDIVATVFGGPSDNMSGTQTAYGSLVAPQWWMRPGVALPARFTERPLPQVRVMHNGKSVICPVMDVGPWNIKDPYWVTGSRPQAETGVDMSGRRTNLAGIDLTPAAANAIGLQGKGVVDWEFVKENTVTDTVTSTSAPGGAGPASPTLTVNNEMLAQAIGQLVLPLLINLLTQGKGLQFPTLALPPPPPPPPPPPAPAAGTSIVDFIAGLFGLGATATGVALGGLGAPVGPEATVAGLLVPAASGLLSLAGMGGVSILPRLFGGILNMFGVQITPKAK
jgi:hypothetical protein